MQCEEGEKKSGTASHVSLYVYVSVCVCVCFVCLCVLYMYVYPNLSFCVCYHVIVSYPLIVVQAR